MIGNGEADAKNNASRSKIAPFRKAIILETILEPCMISTERENYYNCYNILNSKLLRFAPKNSYIAKMVSTEEDAGYLEQHYSYILAPFFPPHLSLPCKAGEVVWVYDDGTTASENFKYWVCRVTTKNFVEDLNYTHFPREYDTGNKDVKNSEEDREVKHTFENGTTEYNSSTKQVDTTKKITFLDTSFINSFIKNGIGTIKNKYVDLKTDEFDSMQSYLSNPYRYVVELSDASKMVNYEAVPSFLKRPSDMVLEGSNNNLIVFGLENSYCRYKIKRNNLISRNTATSEVIAGNPTEQKYNTGVIDILTGIRNNKYDIDVVINDLGKRELQKFPLSNNKRLKPNLTPRPDLTATPTFRNTKSRLYVSQNTIPDEILDVSLEEPDDHIEEADDDYIFYRNLEKIVSYNNNVFGPVDGNINKSESRAAIIQSSDSLRYVARKDIQILLKPESDNIPEDDEDINNYSSITIKTNGDIILKPSIRGYLKLGGEDADKVPLCAKVTDFFVPSGEDADEYQSSFSVKPIQTSGGHIIGTGFYSGSLGSGQSEKTNQNGSPITIVTSVPKNKITLDENITNESNGIFASRVLIK